MIIKFTKMQGLGNDFVVLDLISQNIRLRTEQLRRLADRRLGVGCDQLLVVEAPRDPDMDFRYRIFNADGSEVQQCGNGARCLALYVRDKKLTHKDRIRVETLAGPLELRLLGRGQVEVDMGIPVLTPRDIPFRDEAEAAQYSLSVENREYQIGAVSMGNPHAVLRVDDVDSAPVAQLGPLIERHPDFPQRANVGFMQVVSAGRVKLRVFERGVGETRACGSGACAAVVSGRLLGLLNEQVRVTLPGGNLQVHWEGAGQTVIMSGPASKVFEGSIRL